MKILFSIIINAGILCAITYLLSANPEKGIEAGVILWCGSCSYFSFQAWKSYLIGGIILGLMNSTIRPLLKIISLPLFFLFFWLVSFFINGIILGLFGFIINNIFMIPWVGYKIEGVINFVIAVAIFTFLNTLYNVLLFKR